MYSFSSLNLKLSGVSIVFVAFLFFIFRGSYNPEHREATSFLHKVLIEIVNWSIKSKRFGNATLIWEKYVGLREF